MQVIEINVTVLRNVCRYSTGLGVNGGSALTHDLLIKVIGNTGSNSTREAIHATEQGFAALHINPYYGKTSVDGMVAHFKSVLHMGRPEERGRILYTATCHPGALSEELELAGVKECVGNERVEEYTERMGLLCGVGTTMSKDSALKEKLLPLMGRLFQEPNPIDRFGSAWSGEEGFRLPYVPLPLAKRV
ncbi:hypothetical protein Bca4012_035227 [Brassica carinata]